MLTLAEAAAVLGFSEYHTRRLARAGQLPGGRKIGHSWRFRSDFVDLFCGSTRRASKTTNQPPPTTPTTSATREVLTKSEAAAFLGITLCRLNRWVRLKHIPFYSLPGGTVRFRREQLLEFLLRSEAVPV
jgi:excisionase family DNA binding protein